MSEGPGAKVYVFDAYGTLFDVHSAVARHRETIGPSADRLSELWRTKQLEYSWVRSLAGRYRDFWSLTEDALDFAAAKIGGIAPEARATLLDAYRALDAYPEIREVLGELKAQGASIAILSNGSPAMLDAGVSAAGIGDLLDDVLSVDELEVFKTDPRTYALVTRRFGVTAEDVSFQSSNRWDIAGAKAFGFRCAWINRAGAPDEYAELTPDRTLCDLRGLLDASE
ncbi:haloacid dehalogenase type II [Hansschlegelia zhihuaiae]|uniref:(S)-2-haloacid dehalogenase n=1 Tax=Hansschlegelia zhihuaiae TaxID=405005 RepID=A0A4Q0MIZ9_9HYPH|nr:haloacid dehalogenase type II [Hansschlegelia zhihuaiae]RXF72916.1 haloacid dehalogenase type II [Hansschlegelia zhihuaiae]